MRTIINYFRSLFCIHIFEYEEVNYKQKDEYGDVTRKGIKVSRTCSKCGWHKSYWKF